MLSLKVLELLPSTLPLLKHNEIKLAAIDLLLKDPESTFMYIFPTKALAQDQKRAFKVILSKIPELKNAVVDTYDGDTGFSLSCSPIASLRCYSFARSCYLIVIDDNSSLINSYQVNYEPSGKTRNRCKGIYAPAEPNIRLAPGPYPPTHSIPTALTLPHRPFAPGFRLPTTSSLLTAYLPLSR